MKIKAILTILTLALGFLGLQAQTTWDFTTLSDADATLLSADATGNWMKDSNNRWCYIAKLTNSPLVANGSELAWGKDLLFSCNAGESGNLRIDPAKGRGWIGGSGVITIPGLKRGQTVTISYKTSSNTEARAFTPTNLSGTSGFDPSSDQLTGTGTVTADGDVVLTPTGALYIYSLTVSEEPSTSAIVIPGANAELYEDVVSNEVSRNSKVNQMLVETYDGNIHYYNTDDLSGVDMDKANSTVVITPKQGSADTYYGTVKNISFAKGVSQGENGDIHNNGVVITEAKGWLESAYVKWEPYQGATTYKVYVKGGQFNDYTALDNMLVRDYGSYGRADMVGLKAATNYSFKVVPVVDDAEVATAASTAENITVKNYNREGFAHKNWTKGVGAYNDDGTLKSGARVFYVTKNTAKTIKCDVVTESNGGITSCTGMQAIIEAYQKGNDTTPATFRILGKISADDLDYFGSSAEGLQVKGRNADSELNITIEGIGEDATLYGFGILVRNAKSVEMRNFAVMRFIDDGLSLDTDNSNIWIHHIDMFYGRNKGGDQKKGDGSIDIKSDSKLVTVDNCHFWDAGKSSLCGMKSESGPNYITYHHNWFDHSDSRHARVRTMSVHIYNNYYDGNSKYGAGAATGSSVFVENNYFRNTNKPMLISMQGTDTKMGTDESDAPTFSGEDGGIIKSYGNVFAEQSSNFKYVTYQQNQTHFDAWEATSRNDVVPSTVKAKKGGTSYDNFDTNSSVMYSYTPDAAADVPAKVEGWYGAGRMNHGDFTFEFNNSTDDSDDEIIPALETALNNYTSSLVGIFGGETISGGGGGNNPGDDPGDNPGDDPSGSTIDADIECTFAANNSYTNSNVFDITGNTSNSKGTAVVNGETLTWCLKLETNTSVKFTLDKAMTMTLIFGSDDSKYTIKVDSAKMTGTADTSVSSKQGKLVVELEAGEHTLTKADTGNLFYIGLKSE